VAKNNSHEWTNYFLICELVAKNILKYEKHHRKKRNPPSVSG
jgi:hypothetical protein